MDGPQLSEYDQWYAPGREVAELEYFGHGHYAVDKVTVVRVTPAQIITSSERRFWRKGLMRVGQTSKKLAGININPIRVAPLDNPRVIEALARQPEAQKKEETA